MPFKNQPQNVESIMQMQLKYSDFFLNIPAGKYSETEYLKEMSGQEETAFVNVIINIRIFVKSVILSKRTT